MYFTVFQYPRLQGIPRSEQRSLVGGALREHGRFVRLRCYIVTAAVVLGCIAAGDFSRRAGLPGWSVFAAAAFGVALFYLYWLWEINVAIFKAVEAYVDRLSQPPLELPQQDYPGMVVLLPASNQRQSVRLLGAFALALALLLIAWFLHVPWLRAAFDRPIDRGAFWLLLVLVGSGFAHEIVHWLMARITSPSNKVNLGDLIRRGAFGCQLGTMKRGPFVVTSLAPFLVLTVLPVALAVAGVRLPFAWFFVPYALLHLGHCVPDLLLCMRAWRSPPGSLITYDAEKGWLAHL